MIEPDVVVVAAGPGPAGRRAPPRDGRRGRRRPRPRARARARRRRRDRRSRLGVRGGRRAAAEEPARGSCGTRPRRTRPTSSSHSTRQSRSARGACSWSRARAAVSTISSPRSSCSDRIDYAGLELDALVGEALVHVVRGERRLSGTPGELVTLLAARRPGGRHHHHGTGVPARRRDARARLDARRVERLRGADAHVTVDRRASSSRSARRTERRDERLLRGSDSAPSLSGRPPWRQAAAAARSAEGRRARHPRLVRGLEGRQAGVRAGDGLTPPHPAGRAMRTRR